MCFMKKPLNSHSESAERRFKNETFYCRVCRESINNESEKNE